MSRGLASLFICLAIAGLVGLPSAAAHCQNVPCGPIPVVLELKFAKYKGLTFDGTTEVVLNGTVSMYVNVDNEGWIYDKENPPKMTLRFPRVPPWVAAEVEPKELTVPVDDPKYLSNEGAPNEVQFFWEHPVTVTITKLREPTPEEISPTSKWIRKSDGTYRVTLTASTTGSYAGQSTFGSQYGLMEGYAIKDFRFTPEPGLAPQGPDATRTASGAAPGLALPAVVFSLGMLAFARRRLRA